MKKHKIRRKRFIWNDDDISIQDENGNDIRKKLKTNKNEKKKRTERS